MRRWFALAVLWMVGLPLFAQDIPSPLREWQGWVLHDLPQHACPFPSDQQPQADTHRCAWPGRLTLEADKDGARFTLDVHVDAPGWIALPGGARYWPQQVTANNKPLPVLKNDDQPQVWLESGDYSLHGNVPWSERPAHLVVPEAIGLIHLNLDGAEVTRVERDGDQLTLGEAAATQRTADALSVRVYRHLQDGLPGTLETRLLLNVAGSAREQWLGPALPKGFVATSLDGDLPVRLENDGRLRVQLRPGDWTVTLQARAVDPLKHVDLSATSAPWPAQEIWSYSDQPELRSTRIDGQGTDAAQGGVPSEWQELPAYVMDKSSGITIESGTRGGEGGQGDQLTLTRELWLDFEGDGLNVVDRVDGELRSTQRLDVAAPWQLQRASLNGMPLLITSGTGQREGVEVRDKKIELSAGLRLPAHTGALSAAGWQVPFEHIDATLHLPYGYRLLGAPGADSAPDTWVARWSLLDLFVVALIALLTGRWLGWSWTFLALGFLVLSQHQAGAPRWTLGVALALALLMRALPTGRLHSAARIGAVAALVLGVLFSLPFAATQMQYALHPQLEDGEITPGTYVQFVKPQAPMEAVPAPVAAPPPPPPPAEMVMGNNGIVGGVAARPKAMKERRDASSLASITVSAARVPASATAYGFDTHSVIQAGGGTPHWDAGNDYVLAWSGPVTAEQTMRLIIAPSWLVRILRVVMLALLVVWLARLALSLLNSPSRPRWRMRGGAGVALLAIALFPYGARAQSLPDQNLLEQLHGRLIEAPKCAPQCAAVAQATVQANANDVVVDMEVHVGATVAFALPHPDDTLALQSVVADGHGDAPLSRDDSELWLRLDRGVHRVSLHYHAGDADTVGLRFSNAPQRIVFAGQGWSTESIDAGRLLGDSLALNRVRNAGGANNQPQATQTFPPYVRVTRTLALDVDWTVRTQVERIAPSEGGFSLDLPLLAGEHPTGDDLRIHDGRIGVTFNAGQDTVEWNSRLDHVDKLVLKAPELGERAEVWVLQVAAILHVDSEGVPGSSSDDGLGFHPLPGEQLQLTISRPTAVAGQSVAFDEVTIDQQSGARANDTTVTLRIRSTRGGEHAIVMPAGATLLSAHRDGVALSLGIRDGKLGLPLLPGDHRYEIGLREPHGVATWLRTSSFDLGASAANIDVNAGLPRDRWVLWTWGPTDGPAVLYWPQLIVLLIVAWLLARHAPTPLRFHQWLLLGLGFSTMAWTGFALVAAWLILFGLRARYELSEKSRVILFNVAQAFLIAFSVVALAVLIIAVPNGLLGLPDMHIVGNDSSATQLRWFIDQAAGQLPRGGVFSVSLWVYKIAMLAWALWLANALIGWLRWAFAAWSRGGYWQKRTTIKQEENKA
jgi:hypothetical protein